MKGQTKINLDLHASDDLAWLLRRLVRNIVMGLWVMALLISSSIICTTDMKPKLWGIPALGAFGYVFAFIIVLYVFIKHFFPENKRTEIICRVCVMVSVFFLSVMELFWSACDCERLSFGRQGNDGVQVASQG